MRHELNNQDKFYRNKRSSKSELGSLTVGSLAVILTTYSYLLVLFYVTIAKERGSMGGSKAAC